MEHFAPIYSLIERKMQQFIILHRRIIVIASMDSNDVQSDLSVCILHLIRLKITKPENVKDWNFLIWTFTVPSQTSIQNPDRHYNSSATKLWQRVDKSSLFIQIEWHFFSSSLTWWRCFILHLKNVVKRSRIWNSLFNFELILWMGLNKMMPKSQSHWVTLFYANVDWWNGFIMRNAKCI